MNYYEILQVDKNASKEVIDKAFKVLAKKYHPDAQPEDKKELFEEQFKELNNAYEVLSNPEKRTEYDATLDSQTFDPQLIENMKNFQNELIEQNKQLSNLVNELQNKLMIYENNPNYNVYNSYVPPVNQYYEVQHTPKKHEKHHFLKNFISLLLTILVFVVVCIVLWHIPYTHNLFVGFYENNPIIKEIVDLFF